MWWDMKCQMYLILEANECLKLVCTYVAMAQFNMEHMTGQRLRSALRICFVFFFSLLPTRLAFGHVYATVCLCSLTSPSQKGPSRFPTPSLASPSSDMYPRAPSDLAGRRDV